MERDPALNLFRQTDSHLDTEAYTMDLIPTTTVLPRTDTTIPLDFKITVNDGTVVDLSQTILAMRVRIIAHIPKEVEKPKEEETEEEKPKRTKRSVSKFIETTGIQYFLWTQFGSYEILINNQVVSRCSNYFPFLAYMKAMTFTTMDGKLNLNDALYYSPEIPQLESVFDLKFNNALKQRLDTFNAHTKGITMCGTCLPLDVFSLKRYFLPGTEITLRLWRNKPDFSLWGKEDVGSYELEVQKAELWVKKLHPMEGILRSLKEAHRKAPFSYEYLADDLRPFSLPANTSVFDREIYAGPLPRGVMVFIVPESKIHSNIKDNPLILKGEGMKMAQLTVGERKIPAQPMDMTDGVVFYQFLMQQLGVDTQRQAIFKSSDYVYNNFFLYFNLFNTVGPEKLAAQTGNVAIRLEFVNPIEEACQIVAVFFKDRTVQIDHFGTLNVI